MTLEARVAKIESHIGHIQEDITEIRKDIRELRSEIKLNFNWILGIFIPLFLTGTAATILTIIFHR